MLMSLLKAKYCVCRRCQETNKVEGMYLAFTYLKITCKKPKTPQKTKRKVRIMFFVVKNATRYALLMQLQVKLQKAAEITYLEARYCVTYLQVLELRKKVG